MAYKSYNKWLEDKTANQINFSCSRKEGDPFITETGLKFTKKKFMIGLMLKKFLEESFFKSQQPLAVHWKV